MGNTSGDIFCAVLSSRTTWLFSEGWSLFLGVLRKANLKKFPLSFIHPDLFLWILNALTGLSLYSRLQPGPH